MASINQPPVAGIPALGLLMAGTGSRLKCWTGTEFVAKPLKRWNGTQWVTTTIKRWNGTEWEIRR